MIDWRGVGFGVAWILGLSLCLAVLSFGYYRAYEDRVRLRQVLGRSGYQAALNLGMALFCVGWLDSASTWWEQALWALLAIGFAVQALLTWQRSSPPVGGGGMGSKGEDG